VPKELSKKVKDKLGREKDSNIKRNLESKLILRLQDKDNSLRNNPA